MEAWKANLIEGMVFLVIGLSLVILDFFFIIPIDFLNNGTQVIASLNPTFSVLLIVGFFILGVGSAQSAVTFTIHKLEKMKKPIKT